MTEGPSGGRGELAQRLQELMQAAAERTPDRKVPPTRRLAEEMTARAGVTVSQSWVSRTLRGRTVPEADHLEALCDVLGATADERARIVRLADEVRKASRRLVLGRDPVAAQDRIGRFTRDASLIRAVSLTSIPGELQSGDYVHAIFSDPAAAARRLANQALRDPGRRFEYVLFEGVLGCSILQPQQMVEQLELLIDALDNRSDMRIGILPWGQQLPRLPQHSWYLYDNQTVVTGGLTYALDLSDGEDVTAYVRLTDQLADLAIYGAAARNLLSLAVSRYRNL